MANLAGRDTLHSSVHPDALSMHSPVSPVPSRAPWHPDASMLELSDDSTNNDTPSDTESSQADNPDDPSLVRMSMLGPKMRFHSPAPWETEENGFPFDSAEEPVRRKPFHFVSSRSSSPRPSTDHASGESIRSGKGKKSFEADKARSALHTFVQTGVPSSLVSSAASQSSRPSSSAHRQSQATTHSHAPSPTSYRPSVHHRDQDLHRRASSPSFDAVHPFANPDLASPYPDPPSSPAPRSFSHPTPQHDPAHFASGEQYPITSSPPPIHKESDTRSVRKWEISSPIPLPHSPQRDSSGDGSEAAFASLVPHRQGPDSMTTVSEKGGPAFHLISLEEAREQRKRSVTADSLSMLSTPAGADYHQPDHASSSALAGGRSRARSVGASTKALTALQSMVGGNPADRRESEPAIAGKTLKHKRSGFMRLFNGQKEREETPPVPILSETYSSMNKAASSSIPQRPLAPSISVASALDQPGPDSPSSSSTTRYPSSPLKRSPPNLSIRTNGSSPSPPIHSATVQTLAVGHSPDGNKSPDPLPQSAPANVLQFPALKLRPVSTTFSAQFGEQFLSREHHPSLDPDISTDYSNSPTSAILPLTPGLSTLNERSDKPQSSQLSRQSDGQTATIQRLQEQLTSSKRGWQRQIWELEGQVRDLKAELEGLRPQQSEHYCNVCGRGDRRSQQPETPDHAKHQGVVNRPRARTGISASRFGAI